MNELTLSKPSVEDVFLQSFEQRKELASTLLKSKFLPTAYTTPEQVLTVMLKGSELNIPPMEALAGIHIIQGKPTVSPQLMLGLINRSGQLEDMKIEDNGTTCVVTMKRRGRSPQSVSFGMGEATSMQLSGKDNWKKQPKVMRQWRAVAACARIVFPDVIGGMYTHEEMLPDAHVTEEGELIDVATVYPTETPSATNVNTTDHPVQTDNGVIIGKEFDPQNEAMTRGKYAGTMWMDVPVDYLEWALKNTNGELQIKAKATLTWLSQRGDNQQGSSAHSGDVVEEMFPEKSEEVPITDILESELDEVARTFDVEKIIAWGNRRKEDVKKLPTRQQTLFSKSLKSAVEQAKKARTKDNAMKGVTA